MGRLEKRCTICGHKDEKLHGGRCLLNNVVQDVWVQCNRGKQIGWVICKAGGLLCLTHPILLAIFKPTEAMTPSNPRWEEFTENLNRKVGEKGCKAGRDKTLATEVLKGMGFHNALLDASLVYFESHGGFCDCEIIYNIALAR